MKFRYEFSEKALGDLADIWSFFARVSGDEIAQRRVDAIFTRVDEMSTFPDSGAPHRGKRKNVRRWLAGMHIIFYIFDGECIRVQRVLNARRGDLEAEI